MRIVVMGTGPFAVPSFLRLLQRDEHDVACLITRPVPAPRGRRRASTPPPNPMRDVANDLGLEIHEPPSINEPAAIQLLDELAADLFVVCDYGQILSNEALSKAKLGGINLHASLLPLYRGAAPINWAVYHGESETGITVIHMTPRLDAGPNLVQRTTPIQLDDDAVTLEQRLAEIGATAVEDAITMLSHWDGESPVGTMQDNSRATKAPRLKKQDGKIDWSRSATEIANQVRAFRPWPGCYTDWQRPGREPLRLLISQVKAVETARPTKTAGQVAEVATDRLVISCGTGALELLEIKPAGKKSLPVADYLRGYPMKIGDQLA